GIFKIALGGVGIVTAFTIPLISPRELPNPQIVPQKVEAGERYTVLNSGRETGCEMRRDPTSAGNRSRLTMGDACAAQDSLADLHYWVDVEDGTVELIDAGGTVAVRLMAGDGNAFEAFGSGVPLIALVSADK